MGVFTPDALWCVATHCARRVRCERTLRLNIAVTILIDDNSVRLIASQIWVRNNSLFLGRNVRWPHRTLPRVSHGEYADGTDRQTDGRQTVTLRFLLYAASVIKMEMEVQYTLLLGL